MIPDRYPAPGAKRIFNDAYKFACWKQITDAYATQAILTVSNYALPTSAQRMVDAIEATNPPTPEMVAEYEAEHGHDVVAFLAAYCVKLPPEAGPLIHDGLTSSDLVDYGLFRSVSDHARILADTLDPLLAVLADQAAEGECIRPGRTHGQLASHTSWGHQMWTIREVFHPLRVELADSADYLPAVKYPGPTGWKYADPKVYLRGRQVADRLNCEFVSGTQVVPRDRLLAWACLYVRLAGVLENLALLVRTGARAEISEVREGAERTGSSSIPHKQNPIDSEKVCGLARVARGHFSALAENTALWDDRDISNSSVERVAVPGLAATVEHMVITMTKVMQNLVLDIQQMEGHASNPACFTAVYQTMAQRLFGLNPIETSELILDGVRDYRHYPGMWERSIHDIMDARGLDGQRWCEEVAAELKRRFDR